MVYSLCTGRIKVGGTYRWRPQHAERRATESDVAVVFAMNVDGAVEFELLVFAVTEAE